MFCVRNMRPTQKETAGMPRQRVQQPFFGGPLAPRARPARLGPGFPLQVLGRAARPVGFPLQSVAGSLHFILRTAPPLVWANVRLGLRSSKRNKCNCLNWGVSGKFLGQTLDY